MPADLLTVVVAPGKSAATLSAPAFIPGPYSTTVVAWLVDEASAVLVTVNPAACSVADALAGRPTVLVPL